MPACPGRVVAMAGQSVCGDLEDGNARSQRSLDDNEVPAPCGASVLGVRGRNARRQPPERDVDPTIRWAWVRLCVGLIRRVRGHYRGRVT